MKLSFALAGLAAAGAVAAPLTPPPFRPATAAVPMPTAERQHAPFDGWAAQEGGTRGGALASPAHVYTVRDRAQLLAALEAPAPARIVRVAAAIDMSEGRPYGNSEDQGKRGTLRIPSNTTLIGVAPGAGFVNASLAVANVSQVVIRNLALRNPCDVAPRWDPKDGPKGNWNSLFDAITVSNARHVWIDHNSFTDAPATDDRQPVENGKLKQCHDGALDINQASDFVSVSYNHFTLHEKNLLIGSSDRATGDQGHLRITLKGNLFEHVAERAPRVRYGQVHLLNNYYVGDRKHPVYGHGYSVGVAHASRIISSANAFDIAGANSCRQLVRDPGASPGIFTDQGSLLNGAALADCPYGGDAGWRVPYGFTALPAAEVARHVRDNAGPRPMQEKADGYAEARFVPAAGSPFLLRARQDANGDWQGASLQLVDGGKVFQVELLESRGGEIRRIKQVRRNASLPGVPVVLRYAAEPGPQGELLNVLVDGERATWLVAPPSRPCRRFPGTPAPTRCSTCAAARPARLPSASPYTSARTALRCRRAIRRKPSASAAHPALPPSPQIRASPSPRSPAGPCASRRSRPAAPPSPCAAWMIHGPRRSSRPPSARRFPRRPRPRSRPPLPPTRHMASAASRPTRRCAWSSRNSRP